MRGETRNVCDDDAKWGERAHVFMQVIEGEESRPLGFMSLHDDVADLNNLHMCGHKFKSTLLIVQITWSFYQFWASQIEEFNAIIVSIKWVVPRCNLALIVNFNTPSQLGRIPRPNPSIINDYHAIMSSCTISISHIISALLNTAVNYEEESVESETQDLTTLHW